MSDTDKYPVLSPKHFVSPRLGLHSQRATYRNLTTSIASFWQTWHSNVRFSKLGPSGSIQVIHIGAPHLAHVGCTMSSECGMESNWRMVTPTAGGSARRSIAPTPDAPAVHNAEYVTDSWQRKSAIRTKRTSLVAPHISAFGGKADIARTGRDAANETQSAMRLAPDVSGAAFSTFREHALACTEQKFGCQRFGHR